MQARCSAVQTRTLSPVFLGDIVTYTFSFVSRFLRLKGSITPKHPAVNFARFTSFSVSLIFLLPLSEHLLVCNHYLHQTWKLPIRFVLRSKLLYDKRKENWKLENGERKKQLFIRWNVRTQEKKNWQIPSSLKYGNVSCLMPASMILDKFFTHGNVISIYLASIYFDKSSS